MRQFAAWFNWDPWGWQRVSMCFIWNGNKHYVWNSGRGSGVKTETLKLIRSISEDKHHFRLKRHHFSEENSWWSLPVESQTQILKDDILRYQPDNTSLFLAKNRNRESASCIWNWNWKYNIADENSRRGEASRTLKLTQNDCEDWSTSIPKRNCDNIRQSDSKGMVSHDSKLIIQSFYHKKYHTFRSPINSRLWR